MVFISVFVIFSPKNELEGRENRVFLSNFASEVYRRLLRRETNLLPKKCLNTSKRDNNIKTHPAIDFWLRTGGVAGSVTPTILYFAIATRLPQRTG